MMTNDGNERTEAVFVVRSTGEQFFSFRLPQKSTLWSVLLGREPNSLLPVKPLFQDGEVLVPLTAASGEGTDYYVKAVYERPHDSMGAVAAYRWMCRGVQRACRGDVVECVHARAATRISGTPVRPRTIPWK